MQKTLESTLDETATVQEPGDEPTREAVAALAYELWIERGSPHGSHEEDWLAAEQRLRDQPFKQAATA